MGAPGDDAAAERPASALSVRGFQLLLGGSVASTMAYFASTVAAGYAAFRITGAATMLGLMSLALGAPLLLFALVGGVVADRLPRRRVLLVAFGAAPSFAVAVVLLAVAGFASSAYTALNNTLVMANSEPRPRGRVMSVYLLTLGVTPVAAFPMSWLVDRIGGPAAVALGGAVVAAVVAGVALLYPPYRRIR